jgi:predicted O-methyltransferase YrrM
MAHTERIDDARPPIASAHEPFDQVLGRVADVEGWLSDGQARRLWDRAHELKPGAQAVEIGSYRGRSAIVLASAAPEGATVVAIDPHAGNDRGPQEIHGTQEEGQSDHEAFLANLERAGVSERVRHVRLPSGDALGEVNGDIDLLYIDGAHRYRFARDDIRDWAARVAPGGTLLIHDSFSSVGVTLAQVRCLFFNRRFAYVGRERSMAEYRRSDLATGALVRSALSQTRELGWFARNVALKVAIVTRLRPLQRLLDPRKEGWPY